MATFTTILSHLGRALGVPLGAIPMSSCKITKPHLLKRAGLASASQGTALLFAVPYVVARDAYDPQRNLSLYAVPRDYHGYFQELEKSLLPSLTEAFPEYHFALFSDHSPIAEVNAAASCGLGMIGMNGLLMTKKYGSFVFLGEIITDAPWSVATGQSEDDLPIIAPQYCEKCGACVKACPAGCLPEHRKGCLSALTQKKGELSPEEIHALSKHPLVWGCDTCQLACPHNQRVLKEGNDTTVAYFLEHRLATLDSTTLERMSDDCFAQRAYAWRGRAVIERNIILQENKRKNL